MIRRVITAAVLLPILWIVLKWAPPMVFTTVFGVAICLAVAEAYRLLEQSGARPFKGVGLLATFAVVWSFSGLQPEFGTEVPLVAAVLLTLVGAIWMRPAPPAMLATATNTLLPLVVVGMMLGYTVGIRMFIEPDGEDLLMLLFVCIMFGDTAAYVVGSTLGRRRMAPALSPKKSWEGAAGGLLGSVAGAALAHVWFYQRLPWGHAVVLGLLLGALGILGDLSESMIKRATGAKDSSNLIPGHGGMFDRVDSFILASPVLYYYYSWILGGGS